MSSESAGIARAAYRGRVEWMDTDAAGHHHNSSIVRFVEAAEAQLMRDRGLTEYFGVSPRVRYEADFSSTLRFGQEVTSTVVLERVGTSSLTFRFEVWGEQTGDQPRRLAARGRYVTAHVPRGTGRSAPWPDQWRAALTAPTGAAGERSG
ncbi:acyl-CoA thioesterase [Streptacidiphilus sp. PAMC 29251]